MSRLIDADNLKQEHGMKDDCTDCERETKGKVKSCEYDRVYTLMDFCGWINDMPTIAQERKPGRWIYGDHDVAMCDGYRCNKCGFFVPWDYKHKSIDYIKDYHFCPNCGADMMEGEQE